jgi:hypothetical protein
LKGFVGLCWGELSVFFHAVRAILLAGAALVFSGDDCNFMRIAFPSYWADVPVGNLPLDDENMDCVRLRVETDRQGRTTQTVDLTLTQAWANGLQGLTFFLTPQPRTSQPLDAGENERPPVIQVVPLRC